jgi:hypothetical protein
MLHPFPQAITGVQISPCLRVTKKTTSHSCHNALANLAHTQTPHKHVQTPSAHATYDPHQADGCRGMEKAVLVDRQGTKFIRWDMDEEMSFYHFFELLGVDVVHRVEVKDNEATAWRGVA